MAARPPYNITLEPKGTGTLERLVGGQVGRDGQEIYTDRAHEMVLYNEDVIRPPSEEEVWSGFSGPDRMAIHLPEAVYPPSSEGKNTSQCKYILIFFLRVCVQGCQAMCY